jgi:acetoin utilization protein AcuB
MLVRDVMQPVVITVAPRSGVTEALRLLRTRGIRHLLVMDGDALVGIVSDRDLKQAGAQAERLADRVVDDIMSRIVITIDPSAPVEDAARLMLHEKISALPVIEAGRLIGIVTETDMVRLFVGALGANEPSSRLDVVVGANPAALADIVGAVQSAGAPISSIVTLPGSRGRIEAVIRVATIDPRRAIAALAARGYTIKTAWHGAERSGRGAVAAPRQ